MYSEEMDSRRTAKIEEIAARFCGMPLTAETVFLRPAYQHGQFEREVCDLLIAFRGRGIVLSLKSQDDPSSRTGPKLQRWCRKKAGEAARQISGARRTMEAYPFWCEHWRRGRVDFAAGAVAPVHALAVIETGPTATDTARLADDLPQSAGDTPITYVTLNDALNIVDQLRSFPDLVAYLDARAKLPTVFRRVIGNERLLVHYYMMCDESFDGCVRPEEFLTYLLVSEAEFRRRVEMKRGADRGARFIEYIADTLATRNPNYADGLDPETLTRFDAMEQRSNYLILQEHLGDLRLAERRALGTAFLELIEKVGSGPGLRRAWWTDSKPDFLYLLAAVRGIDRGRLLSDGPVILQAALAHRGKRRGMLIIERDGESFEVCLAELPEADPALVEAAGRLFGHLKVITTEPDSLLPRL
jgi:hypothetical protein